MLSLDQIQTYFPPQLHPFKRNMLREYLQHKILEAIYATDEGKFLIFMGGTALRIVHQHHRFSEDLDFDNRGLTLTDMDNLAAKVGESLRQEGYEVEIDTIFKNAYHCRIKIPRLLHDVGLSGLKEEKILVQLDAEPQEFDYDPETVLLNKFDILTHISVVPLPILLSQKLTAAFKRKRPMGRDFFDILFLWPKTTPNYEYLEDRLGIKNAEELKKYLVESSKTVDFNQLAADVEPFVFLSKDSQKVKLFPEWAAQLKTS